MCKYCRMEQFRDGIFSNDDRSYITTIKFDRYEVDLHLNRDVKDGVKDNKLSLYSQIIVDNYCKTLTKKEIKIKYCPFCGEEL